MSTDLSSGEIDCLKLVTALRKSEYSGIWTLERPGFMGDPKVGLNDDISYLRRLLHVE